MNLQTPINKEFLLYCAARIRVAAPLLLLAALAGRPAFGQIDLSGIWTPLYHEDQPERIPGPELGDYLGCPSTTRRACARKAGTPRG